VPLFTGESRAIPGDPAKSKAGHVQDSVRRTTLLAQFRAKPRLCAVGYVSQAERR